MIIVNIMGGLGNQMFQYACGLGLGQATGQEIRFKIDSLGREQLDRPFELSRVFGLDVPIATEAELAKVIGWWRSPDWMRKLLAKQPLKILNGPRFISESNFAFVSDLTARSLHGAYLHGYWQSEAYFGAVSAVLRKAYQFVGNAGAANTAVIDRMKAAPSIGIHVRRGDYVRNPKAASMHGLVPPEHYIRAVAELRRTMPDARVFAFSDDPEWVQGFVGKNFENAECVTHNTGEDNFRDMQLMTNCDALVIANSSFSWWAAWLNDNSQKVIVAPKRWFQDPRLDTSMLIPGDWTRR